MEPLFGIIEGHHHNLAVTPTAYDQGFTNYVFPFRDVGFIGTLMLPRKNYPCW